MPWLVSKLFSVIGKDFLLNQGPAFEEPLGNGLERLVSQGLLYFYRKLSPLRFLPGLLRFAPTYCLWVSEDGNITVNDNLPRARFSFGQHQEPDLWPGLISEHAQIAHFQSSTNQI